MELRIWGCLQYHHFLCFVLLMRYWYWSVRHICCTVERSCTHKCDKLDTVPAACVSFKVFSTLLQVAHYSPEKWIYGAWYYLPKATIFLLQFCIAPWHFNCLEANGTTLTKPRAQKLMYSTYSTAHTYLCERPSLHLQPYHIATCNQSWVICTVGAGDYFCE